VLRGAIAVEDRLGVVLGYVGLPIWSLESSGVD
jgi:hypothetical protein